MTFSQMIINCFIIKEILFGNLLIDCYVQKKKIQLIILDKYYFFEKETKITWKNIYHENYIHLVLL